MSLIEWNNNNTIEVDGVLLEKKFMIPPNPTDAQKAMMMVFVDGQWFLALWNGGLDKNGKCAYGWETGWGGDAEKIFSVAKEFAENIEKGD